MKSFRQGASIRRGGRSFEKVNRRRNGIYCNYVRHTQSRCGEVGDKNLIEQALKKTGCSQADLARVSGGG